MGFGPWTFGYSCAVIGVPEHYVSAEGTLQTRVLGFQRATGIHLG